MTAIEIEALLREAGLAGNEAKVYLGCLRSGGAPASEIAARSGVHRGIIYNYLKALAAQGLVGVVVRNKRQYFQAVPPSRIVDLLEERRELLKAALPSIEALSPRPSSRTRVSLFEGKQGLKSILDDVLASRRGTEFLVVGASASDLDVLQHYFPIFHHRRVRGGIRMKIAYKDDPSSRERGKAVAQNRLTQVRFLPRGFETPTNFMTWGDNAALTVWSQQSPVGILVSSPEVATGFRKYFELVWRSARP